jgi:hypothetical protein
LAGVASWLALGAGAGCGSGSPSSATDAAINFVDGSFLTCDTETRGPQNPTGMPFMSTGRNFVVELLQSNPAKPVKGNNTWSVAIEDAGGTPLDALDVTVAPWMPDHGHGTEPVAVTPAGSGTYTLMPVYLYMSGFWQVKFTITSTSADAGTTDLATIPICIP